MNHDNRPVHRETDITERMGLQRLYGSAIAKAEIVLGGLAFITGELYAVYHVCKWAITDEPHLLQTGGGAILAILGICLPERVPKKINLFISFSFLLSSK